MFKGRQGTEIIGSGAAASGEKSLWTSGMIPYRRTGEKQKSVSSFEKRKDEDVMKKCRLRRSRRKNAGSV